MNLIKISHFVFFFLITGLFFTSCKTRTPDRNQTDSVHTSANSLDWFGTYNGVLANIGGTSKSILVHIFGDDTYTMEEARVDNPDVIIGSNGKVLWNKAGNEIKLKDGVSGKSITFRVKENELVYIAEEDKKVFDTGGLNVLNKVSSEDITEKYWKLIEINGKPVTWDASMSREPHIILKRENNRVIGHSGCNSFTGEYEPGPGTGIRFSKMVATLAACLNMDIERELLDALERSDNYTVAADGNTLSLNMGRVTPLARFEVVYLR